MFINNFDPVAIEIFSLEIKIKKLEGKKKTKIKQVKKS